MQIRTKQLSKSYDEGRTRVLRELSLEIDAGEFVSIVGTSGSGKTTLLNILAGLDRSYEGEVRLGGQRLEELGDRELSRLRNRHFGFVFQQFNLLDHLSAGENVALPSYFAVDDEHAEIDAGRRAKELLEQVGLGGRAGDRPTRLSGGEKQRVAIARALLFEPSVVFCDEPTGSLDRQTGLETLELLQTLNRREEMTLVVVTHEEHIARMASRIIRLEDGRILADEVNEPAEPDEPGLSALGAGGRESPASETPPAGGAT